MKAILTFRGRSFLPLLAIGFVLAGTPRHARADKLTSRFTDRATPALIGPSAHRLTARVEYESQGANELKVQDAMPPSRPGALAALTLILVIPAGTMPEVSDTPSPPPKGGEATSNGGGGGSSSGPGGSSNSGGGGGHTSGGPTPNPTPEPGTLMLSLTGGGIALLAGLRRRRK